MVHISVETVAPMPARIGLAFIAGLSCLFKFYEHWGKAYVEATSHLLWSLPLGTYYGAMSSLGAS